MGSGTMVPVRRYFGLYRGVRGRLIVFLALTLLQFLAAAPIPFVVVRVFDTALADERLGLLLVLCVVLLGLQVSSAVAGLAAAAWLLGITTKVILGLRRLVFDKLYDLSIGFHQRNPIGEIHDRVVRETERVELMTRSGFAVAAPAVIFTVGILAVLVMINWVLCAITLGFVPVALVVNRVARGRLRRDTKRVHRTVERVGDVTLGTLRTMRQTRILGAEREARAREDEVLADAAAAARRQGITRQAYIDANRVTIATWVLILLAAGGAGVIAGRLTLGELFSFYAGLALIKSPLDQIILAVPFIVAGQEALARVFELLDEPDTGPYRGIRQLDVAGHVSVEHVSFAYEPGIPVLLDASVEVRPGEVVALMGPNGSGKTTIANLMLGFYQPDTGRVCVDGVDYRELDMRHLRRQFGVLTQDPIMLAGTVRDNITYGRPGVTEPELLRAIEIAGARPVVAELDAGLETPAYENGPLLSGGQVQRIALARALLGRPKVLILDEPSTHLDVAGVELLLSGLRMIENAPAMILITHEAEVAAMAETVFHFDHGRVVGSFASPLDRSRRDRDASSA